MPLKVLLIESELVDAYSIETDLLDRGYDVVITHNPLKAPAMAMADWPDLIIFNACAGSVNLEEVCRALDETEFEFPRLIASRVEISDSSHADAHLPVPYNSRQLTQHIKTAIGDQDNRFLRVGDTTLDGLKRQVQRAGRAVSLTPKEFKLLQLLMQTPGEVLNRRTIMKEVWETDYLGDTRTLDVHVRWVREKLEDNPSRPRYILTVRGVGYRFFPKGP